MGRVRFAFILHCLFEKSLEYQWLWCMIVVVCVQVQWCSFLLTPKIHLPGRLLNCSSLHLKCTHIFCYSSEKESLSRVFDPLLKTKKIINCHIIFYCHDLFIYFRIALWMKVGVLQKQQVLNLKTRMSLKKGMKLVSIWCLTICYFISYGPAGIFWKFL